MVVYKCFKCSKEIKSESLRKKVRCQYCGSKILYKTRSSHSTIKAR